MWGTPSPSNSKKRTNICHPYSSVTPPWCGLSLCWKGGEVFLRHITQEGDLLHLRPLQHDLDCPQVHTGRKYNLQPCLAESSQEPVLSRTSGYLDVITRHRFVFSALRQFPPRTTNLLVSSLKNPYQTIFAVHFSKPLHAAKLS